jgi:hypothetical protein
MGYFKDLREHIVALEKAGLLVTIDELINKDTELMPLVRWQFRGLSEDERRAFMFTNVTDVKGRKYDIPVVVGTLAASRQIYGFGLQCKPEEIVDRWDQAQRHPILPKVVEKAPVHEEIHLGPTLPSGEGRLGRISDTDFNSRVRLRAIYDRIALVHEGSGDRPNQYRKLPRADQRTGTNRGVS